MNEPDVIVRITKHKSLEIQRMFEKPLIQVIGFKTIKIFDENNKLIMVKEK